MASGKISKNARRSGLMGGNEAALVIENDATRGKVFVAVRNALKEAGIAFENLSSSHPVAISKGKFTEACDVVKSTLGDKYAVEKEDAGCLTLIENAPKNPAKMVIKESPFEWFS
ncbi:MAG: hypothetical protein IJS60_09700 [Abditibacteriota bacterium]|nr:hypothetical protein [Abditibacteriota bacterium]